MELWTDVIKSILPNSRLIMDVSAWNHNLELYSKGLRNFEYAGLVGRKFDPNGDGRCGLRAGIDCKSYQTIAYETGKQIIINDSFGPGGYLLNYNYDWHNRQLINDRWLDNVVAILLPPNEIQSFNRIINEHTNYPINTIQPPLTSEQRNYKANITNSYKSECVTDGIRFEMTKVTDWSSGMIVILKVKNNSKKTIYNWNAKIGLHQGQNYQSGWNHNFSYKDWAITLIPNTQWNKTLRPNQDTEVGFQVNYTGINSTPKFYYCSQI